MRYTRPLLHIFIALILSDFSIAQSAGKGSVNISGSEQGPIYPCGNSSCPTYDSGQITITVNGFAATAAYGRSGSQSKSNQLANSLATALNGSGSPVTAIASRSTISIVSKITGTISNYALSTSVTHNVAFGMPSFIATASGSTLTGGNGGATAVSTLSAESSNSTSACSDASNFAGNWPYCFSFFSGFATNANNSGAETLFPDPTAGHVSNVSVKQLMYPGWTGRMICEYQPWFGLSSHQSVGYSENNSATVAGQDSFMISEGCDIALIDFYGSLSSTQAFNLATTNALYADLNGRSGFPLKFGIMEDKGALTGACPTANQTESATVSCLESALIADMDYVNAHYAASGVYFTNAGHPVIFTFIPPAAWPVLTSADWTTIWTAVKAHTDAYSASFLYTFEFGSFTSNSYDNGRYGWPQPPAYSSVQQFWWGSSTSSSPTYLDTLYSAGIAHPSQITIGAIYKGFDDNNAAWGGNRVIAQQCGQVLLKTASEISKYFGGTNPQLPYAQITTWNDYEEGTAVEDGIDNCYTVNASLSGSLLTWSLVSSDSYASTSTIHHFNVYFADAEGNLYSAASNLPVTTTSLNLSSIVPPGTWNIYVEMVGQPLIINRMSEAVTYIH